MDDTCQRSKVLTTHKTFSEFPHHGVRTLWGTAALAGEMEPGNTVFARNKIERLTHDFAQRFSVIRKHCCRRDRKVAAARLASPLLPSATNVMAIPNTAEGTGLVRLAVPSETTEQVVDVLVGHAVDRFDVEISISGTAQEFLCHRHLLVRPSRFCRA